ncbi:MAG: NAD+ synthase [Aquificaceae bacterium]|nr:NAD+ synthase [Aquificaceae bacterium]
MESYLNVSIAQINSIVGDLEYNLSKIFQYWEKADEVSDLVVFPELALCGYPPEDLLLRLDFVKACHEAIDKLVKFSKDKSSAVVVGAPYYEGDLYNSLLLVQGGELKAVYKKTFLPNYSVFDEKRYFRSGNEPLVAELRGVKIGFSVCEDIWHPDGWERYYALAGCEVMLNINASPYHKGKITYKENFLKARAQDNIAFVVYVNLVGGQDELVFDGRSLAIDCDGNVIARAKAFEEDLVSLTLLVDKVRKRRLSDVRLRERQVHKLDLVRLASKPKAFITEPVVEPELKEEEELYRAIKLSIKDYVRKNGFEKVVLGLSGGIDSSLVACLATDALGKENVVGVFMPSEFTSEESKEDVYKIAENLGIELYHYPIVGVYKAYLKTVGSEGLTVAEENLQARIRANLLFYLSNKHRWLVLSTSNKSESAAGYTTIYGDMAGGFAPIKDLYKTQVYKLAKYRNSIKRDIPERVFQRPPTAELRPNQTDQDTLPPYELLDRILELYVEEGFSFDELINMGFERDTVSKVLRMIRFAEYKRKQAPLGPKLTRKAFGKDWRMPITNLFQAKI